MRTRAWESASPRITVRSPFPTRRLRPPRAAPLQPHAAAPDIFLSSIRAVEPDSTIRKLAFLEFWEALVRCALVAYSKISGSTVIDKIHNSDAFPTFAIFHEFRIVTKAGIYIYLTLIQYGRTHVNALN